VETDPLSRQSGFRAISLAF